MLTDRFLRDRRGVRLEAGERARLEASISETKTVDARKIIARAGDWLGQSTLLVEGIMSRYLDDRNGLRQLVAIHLPGDFVDLHAYPLKRLDHDVGTMTQVSIAIVPHVSLDAITEEMPELTRKLWFATLLDAAIHRASSGSAASTRSGASRISSARPMSGSSRRASATGGSSCSG